MKKTIVLALSLVLGIATSMAQTDKPCCQNQPAKEKLTPEQKAQIITDRVAKAYDLTADQKAKLLELNQKTLAQRGQQHKPQGDGKRPEGKPEGRPEGRPEMQPGHQHGPQQSFGYIKELKEILTPEQFQAYLTDKMIERSLLPQPQGRNQMHGPRGGKDFKGPKADKPQCCNDNKQCKKGKKAKKNGKKK